MKSIKNQIDETTDPDQLFYHVINKIYSDVFGIELQVSLKVFDKISNIYNFIKEEMK